MPQPIQQLQKGSLIGGGSATARLQFTVANASYGLASCSKLLMLLPTRCCNAACRILLS